MTFKMYYPIADRGIIKIEWVWTEIERRAWRYAEEEGPSEQDKDWNAALLRSSYLPYPLNYLKFYNAGLAYLIVKIFDCIGNKVDV